MISESNTFVAICTELLLLLLGMQSARSASMLDTTFATGAGADFYVEQILEQPDGKILICGLFSTYNENHQPFLARLTSNGQFDPSFRPSPNNWVRHMELQAEGKIVIAGMFTNVQGHSRNLIARVHSDGSLDTTFDPGTGAQLSLGTSVYGDDRPFIIWMDTQADGKILAVGNFVNYNGVRTPGLVRINPDGSRDATFNVGTGFNSWTRFVDVQPNGDVIVSGWFTAYNGRNYNRIVRVNSTGNNYVNFNPFFGDKTSIYSVVPLEDGKYFASGHSLNEQGLFQRRVVKLNANGTEDPSWIGRTDNRTESLLLQADGKLLACGYFLDASLVKRSKIVRFNTDGTADPLVNASIDNFVWCMTPTGDNQLLICGGFEGVDGIPRGSVARLNLPERQEPEAPNIVDARMNAGAFECSVNSRAGRQYILQYKTDAEATEWTSLAPVDGTGATLTLSDPAPSEVRFYRVEVR